MGKAEIGTPKYLANRMRSKGLQRLRWYCQACERQMRDENGFKMHVNSEPHYRQMLLIGENPGRHLSEYSRQFKSDFLSLLRTSHGEKRVGANQFYQEYIANKEHVHMNATHWKTLSEFIKGLGREGICRVDEDDKGGLFVAWIDNSPEALARQDYIKRKERMERGDEERAQALIEQQIARANRDKAVRDRESDTLSANDIAAEQPDAKPEHILLSARAPEQKIKISLGGLKKSMASPVEAPSKPKTSIFGSSRDAAHASAKAVTASAASGSSLQRLAGARAMIDENSRRSRPYP
ncbi:hypothetical protein PYCC9005_004298 [Savitreella phatthalungensis]